jgi:hypothetical protein
VFELFWLTWKTRRLPAQPDGCGENGAGGWDVMKRLTTLALLLAGMFSAPALHSEEPATGASAPLSFPQLNGAADNEPSDEPPAAAPEEATPAVAPAPQVAMRR